MKDVILALIISGMLAASSSLIGYALGGQGMPAWAAIHLYFLVWIAIQTDMRADK